MTDIEQIFFEGQCKRETSDCKSPEHLNTSTMSEESQACLNSAECSLSSIFYQLIRVAIGTQETLSRSPSADEWGELYAMAKKQSLVGICFAAVQRLTGVKDSIHHTPYTIHLPEVLYLTWLGMAVKIQQRNEVINQQCAVLGKRLEVKGYRYAILKGQGVASLYQISSEGLEVRGLSGLRQSGDIDVWVLDKSIPELVEYVKGLGVSYKATAAHVECQLFDDTDVELHSVPAFMRNFHTNRKLVQWFNRSEGSIVESNLGFYVPSVEFNLVYMMVHMYHHVLFEGLGLRQLMDYYFVLRQFQKVSEFQRVSSGEDLTKTIKTPEGSASACDDEIKSQLSSSSSQTSADSNAVGLDPSGKKQQKQLSIPSVLAVLDSLGMKRFAQGIMWIIAHVFANDNSDDNDNFFLGIESNEKVGRLLLDEIMTGGNFGHYDEKNKGLHGGTAIGRSLCGLKRNMKFFSLAPWEILCSPLWSTWHWYWRKKREYI